jgi:phosphoribosylaminoimidazole carboxylase PurE protein
MANPKVLIVMGSAGDMPVMQEASNVLSEFAVESKVVVASAHRTPEKAAQLAKNAAGDGIKVIIAGAGYAAHLAGAMAAHTILPVIGVPLEASPLSGLDSLLSTVQMPSGVPVACVAVGKAGARNAGILAVQMLALSDDKLKERLIDFRKGMEEKVEKANEQLK